MAIAPCAVLVVALVVAPRVAHADMSACSSAYVKSDVDVQIALYTRCITGGDMSKGNLAGAFTNRAVAYMSKGEFDKAFADLNSAIRFYPKLGMAYYNRALIDLRKGELEAAFADLSSAIKYGPSRVHASAYSNRALLQYRRGSCTAAVKDLDAALVRAPKRGELQAFKGWILATCDEDRSRNGAEALRAAQKAVVLMDSWESHRALAAAYAELGRFDESVAEMLIAKEQAARGRNLWQPQDEDVLASLKAGKPVHQKPGNRQVMMAGAAEAGGDVAGDSADGAATGDEAN
jgi:tetratricopeptide (TPR) repeat protein